MFVAEKTIWKDGEIWYNITVQDSRYDRDNTTLWSRIKGAAKILFGKPVYYSDVVIESQERFKEFVDELKEMI